VASAFGIVSAMVVLGLNFGHDASISIVQDGTPRLLVELERHTGVKHSIGLDGQAVLEALKSVGLSPADVRFAAVTTTQNIPFIFGNPEELSFEYLTSEGDLVNLDSGLRALWAARIPQISAETLRQKDDFQTLILDRARSYANYIPNSPAYYRDAQYLANFEELGWPVWPDELAGGSSEARYPCLPIQLSLFGHRIAGGAYFHHASHAGLAYLTSGFEDALVVTYDGCVGDEPNGYTGAMAFAGLGGRLHPIDLGYLASAHIYERVGRYLGLGAIGAAGKLMGLAPYGEARLAAEGTTECQVRARDTARWDADPREAAPAMWLEQCSIEASLSGLTPALSADTLAARDGYAATLAATTQALFEQSIMAFLRQSATVLWTSHPSVRRLCVAGGGALNCPTNSMIHRSGMFEDIFIPPACDDSGLSMGAALLASPRRPKPVPLGELRTPYLGMARVPGAVENAVAAHSDVLVAEFELDAPLAAAEALAQNKVIAWFEGRSEVGPRALGHRSILANPSYAENWSRVNRIKGREAWRPFAPMVLADRAAEYFADGPLPSPFMLFTHKVVSDRIPAVTHVDGTARIQTVAPDLLALHRLISHFDRLTGLPVVMNTSFNARNQPIVETEVGAVAAFLALELDVLFLDGVRISRRAI